MTTCCEFSFMLSYFERQLASKLRNYSTMSVIYVYNNSFLQILCHFLLSIGFLNISLLLFPEETYI